MGCWRLNPGVEQPFTRPTRTRGPGSASSLMAPRLHVHHAGWTAGKTYPTIDGPRRRESSVAPQMDLALLLAGTWPGGIARTRESSGDSGRVEPIGNVIPSRRQVGEVCQLGMVCRISVPFVQEVAYRRVVKRLVAFSVNAHGSGVAAFHVLPRRESGEGIAALVQYSKTRLPSRSYCGSVGFLIFAISAAVLSSFQFSGTLNLLPKSRQRRRHGCFLV